MRGCRYVQWCHGAPSLIPVLAKAAELLEGHTSQGPILDAARKAADVVWERGLLTKARRKTLFQCCDSPMTPLSALGLSRNENLKKNRWGAQMELSRSCIACLYSQILFTIALNIRNC